MCNTKDKLKKTGLYRWFVTFLLLAIGCCGLAYGGDIVPIEVQDSFSGYVTNNDLSFRILRSVFGRVEGVSALSVGQSTVFGVIFKGLSYGALFIESIMLVYMVVKIITEANIDSNGMSRSAMLWTPIRCALSTTLLIPSSATGYSMIHSLVLIIVIQGVGLANMLWSNATQFLIKDNHQLYSSVVVVGNGSNMNSVVGKLSVPDPSLIDYSFPSTVEYIDKTAAQNSANIGSVDVMRSMLCVHAVASRLDSIRQNNLAVLQRYQQERSNVDGKVSTATVSLKTDQIATCIRNLENGVKLRVNNDNLYRDLEETGKVVFPGTFDLSSYRCANDLKATVGDSLIAFPNAETLSGLCGSISYGAVTGGSDRSNELAQLKRRVLLDSIVANLVDVAERLFNWRVNETESYNDQAKKFVNDNYNGLAAKDRPCYSSAQKGGTCTSVLLDVDPSSTATSIAEVDLPLSLMQNAYGYQTAVYSQLASRLMTASGSNSTLDPDKLYDTLNNQGWMFLGNYYLLLSNAVNNVVTEQKQAISDSYLRIGDGSSRSQMFYQLAITGDQQNTLQKVLGGESGTYYKALRDSLLLVNAAAPLAKKRMSDALITQDNGGDAVGVSSTAVAKAIKDSSGFKKTSLGWQMAGLGIAVGLDPTRIVATVAFSSLPLQICVHHMTDLVDTWTELVMGSGDPIFRVEQIGQKMISTVSDILSDFYKTIIIFMGASAIWPVAALAGEMVAAVGTFWGTTSGLVSVFQSLVELTTAGAHMGLQFYTIFLPLIVGIAVPLFACGILLSVYVPLIPTLLFIFGGISWIISVLVLLVAAPIICFLMLWGGASQENPLLSREAEQFIHQLIGAFFRPALMVVGFLGGMVLSYIGFDLLNMAVGRTYEHFFGGSTSISQVNLLGNMSSIGSVVKGLGFMGVYTYAAISIVNMSFSLIYLLYSETMRVVGVSAPAVGLEERHTEAAKVGATQFGEAGGGSVRGIGEGASQRAEGVSGAMKGQSALGTGMERSAEKRKEVEKEKKGSSVEGA